MTQSRLLNFARSSNRFLRFNERHQRAASHALKIYRSNAIYSFIPKNACSTMRLSLAIANCCIPDASRIDWIHDNNDTFMASLEDLVTVRYTFVILRDPFARLASCFLDKIASRSPPAHILRELTGRDLDLDAITFEQFVACLHDESVLAGNMHWRPQSEFLVYDRYDDYFSVENFARDSIAIQDRAGLTIVDARPFTAHGLDKFTLLPAHEDHSGTPVRDIARMKQSGVCPHPLALFTPVLAGEVARIYANDIDLYAAKIGALTFLRADG